METLIVNGSHISALLERIGVDRLMEAMVEELSAACHSFDSRVHQVRRRDGFHYHVPQLGLLEWMPCMHVGQQVSVKMVAYHPANPAQYQVPTILSTVHLYDPRTGHLTGLIDGTYLTALRTGAASTVASRVLANPASGTIGIIGCGAQAITQLHGLALNFDVSQVLIQDIDPAAEESFARRTESFLQPSVRVRRAPVDLIVQTADILVTATSQSPGEPPLFGDLETRPWLHVNAVGSDFAGKVELPLSLLSRGLVCPDDREQALQEGECQRLTPDQVGPELWELVQQERSYQAHRESLTVFDSTGWALEDQVAGNLLMAMAREQGFCDSIQLERITRDPRDPYELTGDAARLKSPSLSDK